MTSRRALLAGAAAAVAVPVAAVIGLRGGDPRGVVRLLPGRPSKDGAGVKLSRTIGSPELRMLDPFLLLDAFGSDDPADYLPGFPRHPHRGFETVTILLDGAVEHRDSVGNAGRLLPGSLQWMTAGRGIVHSEMPQPVDGKMRGFQLWVNLPAAEKWIAPRYQDLGREKVPEVDLGDARARVLAGRIGSTVGPVDGVVIGPTVLDVTLAEGGSFRTEVPGGHTAFVQAIDGTIAVGPERTAVAAGSLAVLGPGRTVSAEGRGRFLLVAGAPIGEPVARGGPFVMNTEEEIRQAWEDYRAGRLGS